MLHVGAFRPWEVSHAWSDVKGFIEKALHRSGAGWYCDVDHIFDKLEAGRQVLFVVFDTDNTGGVTEYLAAATVTVGIHPGGRECELLLLGGRDGHRWHTKLWEAINDFAKGYRCERVTTGGREEWGSWFEIFEKRPVIKRVLYTVEI